MASVYEIITERIVAELEAGKCPWRKTWKGGASAPRNITGRAYRGINAFILGATSYASPVFLTYKQAAERGGHVRKGEKGLPVVFWKWLQEKDAAGEPTGRRIPLLRYYTVFNIAQTEGVKLPASLVEGPAPVFDPIAEAEAIVAELPANAAAILEGAGDPCYRPSSDQVVMPKREQFSTLEEFYSVLFHELTHSTGHESRLSRPGVVNPQAFASHEYSREELVAEMGAAFLCGEAGILPATIENSAAYLRSWIGVLKGDARLVVIAAAQAQKAADWILAKRRGAADVEGDAAAETEAATETAAPAETLRCAA